jgi:hypothetical protein
MKEKMNDGTNDMRKLMCGILQCESPPLPSPVGKEILIN